VWHCPFGLDWSQPFVASDWLGQITVRWPEILPHGLSSFDRQAGLQNNLIGDMIQTSAGEGKAVRNLYVRLS
jgi:hypothetical protein